MADRAAGATCPLGSDEAVGIYVHRHAHARREAQGIEPFADHALEFGGAAGVYQQAVAVAAPQERERGGRGAEDEDVVEARGRAADASAS